MEQNPNIAGEIRSKNFTQLAVQFPERTEEGDELPLLFIKEEPAV